MRYSLRIALLLAASWIVALSTNAKGVTVYVSPDGSDRWSGLSPTNKPDGRDGPLSSIPSALKAARELRNTQVITDVTIQVASGRYELNSALLFTPDDSGTLVTAAPGAQVNLSGGVTITGWERSRSNPEVWQADVPQVRSRFWTFQQLFADRKRLTRARFPNRGYLKTIAPLGQRSPIDFHANPADIKPDWMKSPDTRLVILEKWTDLHLPIASYDAVSGIAKLPGGPRPAWMDEADSRYWLENFPAALDEPGEWYLEKSSGTLSLMPPSGTAPGTNVIAPRLTELVRFQGNGRNHENVYAVRIRGIRFSDCDYDMPLNGLISPQAAIGAHGAVVAEYTKDCSIEDCVFENIGGYAIELGVGCRGFQFRGNRIQDTGAGGIRIGDTFNLSPNSFDANYGNQILDNELVSLGRVFPSGVGILILQSANNRIAHNHIHDLYYTGISVGWTWGYNDTPCRENLIEFNLVERIGQGVLTDMGGIYTLGPQPGTVIRNNIFRDIVSHDYGGWGLYTDEGSTGILLENNVVYGCKSAGFHQHYGKENIVRNNIFAFNRDHQLMRTRAEAHRSFSFTKNVVVFNSGDLLGSDWTGSTNGFLMSGNLYWDTRVGTNAAAYSFAGAKFPAWQASGLDRDSIIADPLLVDPVRPELGLKQGSPAFAMGFQAIDAASVGVRPRQKRDY